MVRITKESIYFEYLDYDEEGLEVIKMVDVFTMNCGLVSYFAFSVSIEEGVTVMDFLRHLAKDRTGLDFAMDSSLGGHQLKVFLMELLIDMPIETGIRVMEIAHEVDPVGADGEIVSTVRFRGVASDGDPIYVEFLPISVYKNLPLVLNTSYTIFNAEGEPIFDGSKKFTLYEVLHSILNEISYHGDAATRKASADEMSAELHKREEEEANSVKRLQDDLDHFIKNEEYEKAAKIRDRLKQLSGSGKKPPNALSADDI